MTEKPKKSYTLHVGPAKSPIEVKKKVKKKSPLEVKKKVVQKFHKVQKKAPIATKFKETTSDRVWGFLRLISTAGIIFIVLFFVMNWNAYSTLFLNKLGLLQKGEDMFEDMLPETEDKELLDLSKDFDEQKKQIPDLDLAVSPPDTRIIIPRINQNVPVVTVQTDAIVKHDWDRLEQEIQEALRDGIVHYPGTATPGEVGNVVLTGHSSYFPWDPGRFKDVFALLHDVQVGDKIYIYHNQERFAYEVSNTEVVLPNQVEVLTQAGDDRLTLITCTPVGTNLKRLIVFAQPIYE